MRIVICGAGLVGSAIASHLAAEQNDVTVIDASEEKIQRVVEHADVRGVVGVASHPDVLADAGLSDAQLLIAVTESDEINMVATQVAHTIFRTPTRIARIRSWAYLNPEFRDLYGSDHMPIDHIISPEEEVSSAVERQLRLPGAFDVKDMADGKARLIGVLAKSNCPILSTPLRHLTSLFPELSMTIIAIVRGTTVIVPRDGRDELEEGDKVYFVCDAEHTQRCMAAFGHNETEAASAVIAGGGNIGVLLAQKISQNKHNATATIIEIDKAQAHNIAQQLTDSSVVCGDTLDADILEEAGVATTGTFLSVSNDDEVNMLSALLAKRMGAGHTVALVNNPAFVPLMSTLGIDAVVNPPQITVSSILEHVRRGRIRDVHSVLEGHGEVLEAEISPHSDLVGQTLRGAKIPKGLAFGAIIRRGAVIAARGETVIEANDLVILFAKQGRAAKAEKLLSADF
ncbi:MAG: Trk system potassium transporter TrkA [Candidatus Puniceispirillaceae bacterium]